MPACRRRAAAAQSSEWLVSLHWNSVLKMCSVVAGSMLVAAVVSPHQVLEGWAVLLMGESCILC